MLNYLWASLPEIAARPQPDCPLRAEVFQEFHSLNPRGEILPVDAVPRWLELRFNSSAIGTMAMSPDSGQNRLVLAGVNLGHDEDIAIASHMPFEVTGYPTDAHTASVLFQEAGGGGHYRDCTVMLPGSVNAVTKAQFGDREPEIPDDLEVFVIDIGFKGPEECESKEGIEESDERLFQSTRFAIGREATIPPLDSDVELLSAPGSAWESRAGNANPEERSVILEGPVCASEDVPW